MADSGGIPELIYNHPDGRQRTRLEMDQWLREVVPKVHWLRIIANRVFGLPKQVSWDMREIVLKHWLLDEMIRRGYIVGEQLGINTNTSNDEAELRQFTQKLAVFTQNGFAVFPQHAEGVDMSGYSPPPPPTMGVPVPPNGQQAAYPGPPQPPGPPGPPGGYAQPPGGYGPPMTPPGPPGPPQGYAAPPGPPAPPQVPQQQYAPQPPPAGPQMAGPPMGPPPGVPAPPQAPAAGGRGGRKRAADAAPSAPAVGAPPAPPGFAPAPFPGGAPQAGPQGFAPLPGQGPAQQSFAIPPPGAAQQAAPQTVAANPALEQKIDQLLSLVSQQATKIAALEKKVDVLAVLNTVIGRAMYQRQGSGDPVAFLNEIGVQLPQ